VWNDTWDPANNEEAENAARAAMAAIRSQQERPQDMPATPGLSGMAATHGTSVPSQAQTVTLVMARSPRSSEVRTQKGECMKFTDVNKEAHRERTQEKGRRPWTSLAESRPSSMEKAKVECPGQFGRRISTQGGQRRGKERTSAPAVEGRDVMYK
jgi:hypothetical protein